MSIDGTGFGLTDSDDDGASRRHQKETSMDVSAFQQILERMDPADYRRLMADVERARSAGKPSLKDGAKLWAAMNDDGMTRTPRAAGTPPENPNAGADLSQVARPQDYQATRAGGMNIPRGISPERLAQLLQQASPGDSFQVNPGQARDIW